uniref:Uncharacterized protein n=1 Tax=Arundo donax TaxID=35708 RepID=A0A0A9EMT6_ARUDO
MVRGRQTLCLPFTIAWSIAVEPCLPFTILSYKATLYIVSSTPPLCQFCSPLKNFHSTISSY